MNELLWDVYASVFEVRFAIWLGDSCCPYLELTPVSWDHVRTTCWGLPKHVVEAQGINHATDTSNRRSRGPASSII